MSKTFIISGELSGDKLGAWYVDYLGNETSIEAIGGHFLKARGVKLYDRVENLSFVGVVEVIKHIPFILRYVKKLVTYICENGFDHVVLVDFPGFNLLLARKLKARNPALRITYLSPPQLWVWGAWRVKKIRKFCDKVVVIYPFEVAWYKERGVDAQWLGYPHSAKLLPYFDQKKEKKVALVIASRKSEVGLLLPIFVEFIKLIKARHQGLTFVLPVAESLSEQLFIDELARLGASDLATDIEFVCDEAEKYAALSSCIFAISKPGTVTLELALLGVPMAILYKTSALTYAIARRLATVQWMGLPNLLLNRLVAPEFIQKNCDPARIALYASKVIAGYEHSLESYGKLVQQQRPIRSQLGL